MTSGTRSRFTDPRLTSLNDENCLIDNGMRKALEDALAPGEEAQAAYSVSAHIWVDAVLTDRALLLIKGAVRARVHRVPLPLQISRPPGGTKKGVRVVTPLGRKTLWGSKLDPGSEQLLRKSQAATTPDAMRAVTKPGTPKRPAAHQPEPVANVQPASRLTKRETRKAAGKRPAKPRRQRVRRERVGFAPPSTIWDLANNCIKCGRPLTDPRSRQARVGTSCIKIYGSQQRHIPNPAYTRWSEKKTKAEVDYIAAKAKADAILATAKADYDAALAEWLRIRRAR